MIYMKKGIKGIQGKIVDDDKLIGGDITGKIWKLGKEIGHGQDKTAYQVYRADYVLIERFTQKDFRYSLSTSKVGISPPIMDYWVNDERTHISIITKKMVFLFIDDENSEYYKLSKPVKKTVIQTLFKKIYQMHQMGINHNDLGIENIMIDPISKIPYIIDFGNSYQIESTKFHDDYETVFDFSLDSEIFNDDDLREMLLPLTNVDKNMLPKSIINCIHELAVDDTSSGESVRIITKYYNRHLLLQ